MRRTLLLICLSASPTGAETRMTAADFEAWSTGKTLVYALDGSLWGREMHLAGRRTIDADEGGVCRSGQWYAQGNDICFVYESSPGPFCWRFLKDKDRVFAEATADPLPSRYEVRLSDSPLDCPGPEVGA